MPSIDINPSTLSQLFIHSIFRGCKKYLRNHMQSLHLLVINYCQLILWHEFKLNGRGLQVESFHAFLVNFQKRKAFDKVVNLSVFLQVRSYFGTEEKI